MRVYFNEEASWEPEDGYIRGIPDKYEDFLELVDDREPVFVDGDDAGLIQTMDDSGLYGIFEKREDPLTEYVLEFGRYDRDALLLEDVTFLEQEHLQDTARLVKKGTRRFTDLEEIRTRLMQESWDSKIVKFEDVDLEEYTPIH